MNECKCGLIKQGKAGTSVTDGIELCNECGLPANLEALRVAMAAAPAAPEVDTIEWRWRRNGIAIDALRASGGKYERALNGDGLASFSLMGTDSWSDFAALSMQAMQLETLTDIARTMEKLVDRVEALENTMKESVKHQ